MAHPLKLNIFHTKNVELPFNTIFIATQPKLAALNWAYWMEFVKRVV